MKERQRMRSKRGNGEKEGVERKREREEAKNEKEREKGRRREGVGSIRLVFVPFELPECGVSVARGGGRGGWEGAKRLEARGGGGGGVRAEGGGVESFYFLQVFRHTVRSDRVRFFPSFILRCDRRRFSCLIKI